MLMEEVRHCEWLQGDQDLTKRRLYIVYNQDSCKYIPLGMSIHSFVQLIGISGHSSFHVLLYCDRKWISRCRGLLCNETDSPLDTKETHKIDTRKE